MCRAKSCLKPTWRFDRAVKVCFILSSFLGAVLLGGCGGGGGGGGGGAGGGGASDTTAPADVSSFTAAAGDGQIALSWTHPSDSDFSGVLILRRNDGTYPTDPTDGNATQVYDGTDTIMIDGGLNNGTTYYYTAYAYDFSSNYSGGVQAESTAGVSIPFNPETGPFLDTVALSDDSLSAVLPIGFDFVFFGITHNEFVISSNGFLSFDTSLVSSGCCIGRTIPSDDDFNNIIALAWTDLNPGSGGTISYETLGVSPNRRLVVDFDNVPCFDLCDYVTVQAILYEGTNEIEIQTTHLGSGRIVTQGVENSDGTIALYMDGRVADVFGLDDDAIRLITNGGGSPAPNSYSLSVSKSGTGSGTVTSSPSGIDCGSDCSQSYFSGTSVTLTASPSTGSIFSGWSGACSGTGSCTVSMTSNKSVTATFSITFKSLSVSKSGTGSGTVTSSPFGINCGSDCFQSYAYGTSVTLTASPSSGSSFSGWSGACSGTGSCTVSMTSNKSVTATFTTVAVSYYSLSVSKSGTGSGTVTSSPSGINCGSDCSQSYLSGTSVTLTASPSSSSTFSGWTGSCSSISGNSCTVLMFTVDKSVTATFAQGYPDLAVESVSSPSSSTFRPGSSEYVSVTFRNNGNAPAGFFYVTFYLSTDSVINSDDTELGYCTYSSLAAGSQATCSEFVTIPSMLRDDYYFGAYVDTYDQVLESDNSNNKNSSYLGFLCEGQISSPINIPGSGTPADGSVSSRTGVVCGNGSSYYRIQIYGNGFQVDGGILMGPYDRDADIYVYTDSSFASLCPVDLCQNNPGTRSGTGAEDTIFLECSGIPTYCYYYVKIYGYAAGGTRTAIAVSH